MTKPSPGSDGSHLGRNGLGDQLVRDGVGGEEGARRSSAMDAGDAAATASKLRFQVVRTVSRYSPATGPPPTRATITRGTGGTTSPSIGSSWRSSPAARGHSRSGSSRSGSDRFRSFQPLGVQPLGSSRSGSQPLGVQPLGVGPAARGQTDLEVFPQKLLNRSDPEATDHDF